MGVGAVLLVAFAGLGIKAELTSGAPYAWKLHPIVVKGQHLYDSVTGEQFRGKGIGFPKPELIGQNVTDWIATLRRISQGSSKINAVRIYAPPDCMLNSDCFVPFMQEADNLGIYVLFPGSGSKWGYLPLDPSGCGSPASANGCYKSGGVLGFGQLMIARSNFPNTLGIVISNEIDRQDMYPFAAVLKGYARDLKSHMEMCNTNADSPTRGQMRQIPLVYAKSDNEGNPMLSEYGDYVFCGSANISVDIMGLNMERFCDDTNGPREYKTVDELVAAKKWPGAFMFAEDGCFKRAFPNNTRDWAQVKGEFHNYPSLSGFFGYTYYDAVNDWSMFDGPMSNAKIYQDGLNFFHNVDQVGDEPKNVPEPPVTPACASTLGGQKLDTVDSVQWYQTGPTGWAKNCPKPYALATSKPVAAQVYV